MLLGEALRARREQLGISQSALARACGVGQQSVSRWEQGLGVPRPSRVQDLARVLELDAQYLHRLAGFLPDPAERSPAAQLCQELYARIEELTDDDLWLLVERLWQELTRRRRTAAAPAASG